MTIPFNKPFLTGKEIQYIEQAVASGRISGNGEFTKRCQDLFQERFGFRKCLLTHSCTAALEMASILMDIGPGDEVIMPSYTFVSTANAFILRGASIVFADSLEEHPCIDAGRIEALITPRTKAIVVVHYAGIACDMDVIMAIASKHDLFVVEDAAQAITATYKGRALGGIGHFGTFSFHETKNVISGEGGMLVVNDERFVRRAEIVWEKGTDRAAFYRGEVDKYGWIDVGSSFLPSELIAAFLFAQLEQIDEIQRTRVQKWDRYKEMLSPLADQGLFQLPNIPDHSTNNGHIFYLICQSLEQRSGLIAHLKERGILSVFHYLSLHSSKYFSDKHDGRELRNADHFSDTLIRLPLYHELSSSDQDKVVDAIKSYFENR